MAKDILKEAIADAKAVREVALANAKAALEEAFTPKLQNMLSAKLSEELDENGEIDLEEVQTYSSNQDTQLDDEGMDYTTTASVSTMEGKELDEVVDLEEILNELELEEGADAEETVDEDKEMDEEKEELDEMQVVYNAETANNTHYTADSVNEGCTDCDNDFDLDSLLEEINKVNVKETKVKPTKVEKTSIRENATTIQLRQTQTSLKSVEKELNETKKALKTTMSELNEVNLLNSKLLYVNRIFRANNLTDGQKLRVVETFDKAASVKEAKLIYETVKDSFNIRNNKSTPKRKTIKEGFGMASKAAGVAKAPKRVISEADDMVARMQKLANITKINQ